MQLAIDTDQLIQLGLQEPAATQLIKKITSILQSVHTKEKAWQVISQTLLTSPITTTALTAPYPFAVHLYLFTLIFPQWHEAPETAPLWLPTDDFIRRTNIFQLMTELNVTSVAAFHRWTVTQYEDFWQRMIKELNIRFKENPKKICDLSHGTESPRWFPGAKMNIVDSCFTAPLSAIAIIYEKNKTLCSLSYGELHRLSNRIANSLINQGFNTGDTIGIAMPMNVNAIAIYLGIIKMGGVVVSIADSFSSQEMTVRLKIANAKATFTQDFIPWGGKKLPLYERVAQIDLPIIVLPCQEENPPLITRAADCAWQTFLVSKEDNVSSPCDPLSACNILFSSGTTAQPKAIPWNHTTPIKVASDAYFHQNIQPGDILAWPTNLGWMMGPWLIFAAFINRASIALFSETPKDRAFGEFVEQAKVTMLGVVPTLVTSWRQSHCMERLDWSAIKVFSSTGECSNPEDMFYLMSLAGYKPVIEYCGGTEIGGSYVTSTVIQNNYPSLFSTPAMGLDFIIIDENGLPAETGEVAILPPSIGLSTNLLNADHHHIYFADMPKTPDGKILRRHGDHIKQLPNHYYTLLGRVDDTMNLGGIKVSAAEIERTLTGTPNISEVAAIAVSPPHHGPSQLIIYAATTATLNKHLIQSEMQKQVNLHLNPLFKIHDVVFVKELPKTASNKIMRRILRKDYIEKNRLSR